jgi:hypothetical protein
MSSIGVAARARFALKLCVGVALGGSWVGQAAAFCRTTTCDPEEEPGGICPTDRNNCLTSGEPLWWPDHCVTFGVQAEGSPLRGITYDRASEVAEDAFQSWISAGCGGDSHPAITVANKGEIYCDKIEYQHDPPAPNANVIVFRDADWPYSESRNTIALTTITFNKRTGEILDADIEVNSQGVELTTGDVNVRNDLQSVLTHEAGHFFGLAHTKAPNASMNPTYNASDLSFRSLSKDDRSGICSVYPPGTADTSSCVGEEPRHGFSRYCGDPVQADGGCVVAPVAATKPASADSKEPAEPPWRPWWALSAGALGVYLFRRRG